MPTARWRTVDQAEYFARKGGEPLAQRWERSVEEAIYGLLKFPEQGRLRYFKTLEVNDLRTIAVPGFPNHLIFYRFLAEENVLLIVTVAYGGRDLETLLSDIPLH
jgi:plasmid stabilization system protein ParE